MLPRCVKERKDETKEKNYYLYKRYPTRGNELILELSLHMKIYAKNEAPNKDRQIIG
jgi:hypothetical protein